MVGAVIGSAFVDLRSTLAVVGIVRDDARGRRCGMVEDTIGLRKCAVGTEDVRRTILVGFQVMMDACGDSGLFVELTMRGRGGSAGAGQAVLPCSDTSSRQSVPVYGWASYGQAANMSAEKDR